MSALTYREAGVDLCAASKAKESLADLIRRTRSGLVVGEPGGFGGVIGLPSRIEKPLLVSSADGVGTKLRVAFAAGVHGTVGRCLVNHCVNDILVQGARPLFFMDYLAVGRLSEKLVTEVVGGIASACLENATTLLGGETAEMSGFYEPGEYELAGFIVGVAEAGRLIDGSQARKGDHVVALESSGLHTNGYALARRIVFEEMGLALEDELPGTGRTVAEELLEVHRSYLPALLPLLGESGPLRALAHVTGGGVEGNLPRVLPRGLGARIRRGSWPTPPVFRALAEGGRVAPDEMARVFNMGAGMLAVAAPSESGLVVRAAESSGIGAHVVGKIVSGSGVSYA